LLHNQIHDEAFTQLPFTPQNTNTAQPTQSTLSTQRVETCYYVFLWMTG